MRYSAILLLSCALVTSGPLFGQNPTGAPKINYFEGEVSLNGETLQQNQGLRVPVGASITTRNGRVEILLAPDIYLRAGQQSSVRIVSENPADLRVELLAGAAVIDSTKATGNTPVNMIVRTSTTRTEQPGDYRFDFNPPQLHVYRGQAEVALNGQKIPVKRTEVLALGNAPLQAVAQPDNLLDVWSTNRRIRVAGPLAGTYTTGAPQPEQPLNEPYPDITDGTSSSIGLFSLNGSSQLMATPDRPYNSMNAYPPGSYGLGLGFYGFGYGLAYPYGLGTPNPGRVFYGPRGPGLSLPRPGVVQGGTQFIVPGPVLSGGQIIGH